MARRLYRSKSECVIGGVAGGIAEYFDIDPTIVRILWVLFALADGIGILAYIIAWIVIPANPQAEPSERFEKTEGIRQEVIDKAKEVEARLKGETPPPAAAPVERAAAEGSRARRDMSGAKVLGIALVCVGGLLLARNFCPWFDFGALWPVVLIIAGAILLATGLGGRGR
ncbi:MAG TPA: PspC domain-containing protein [Firmicutes bacterium]|nr:PspC domain-containing protein [Bacillota bacterium]